MRRNKLKDEALNKGTQSKEKLGKRKWNKVKASVIAGAMALSVFGAYSAFTSVTDTKVNTFNIVAGEDGAQAGTIVEPNWDEENAKDMLPKKTVAKDPKVVSDAAYETWVFLTVEVPAFQATLNGTADVYDAVIPNFNADGKWTLVKSEKSSTAGTNSCYTYGYKDKVAAKGETTSLFTEFTVPDFTKTEALSDSIDISGRMIQTEGYATLAEAAAALGLN